MYKLNSELMAAVQDCYQPDLKKWHLNLSSGSKSNLRSHKGKKVNKRDNIVTSSYKSTICLYLKNCKIVLVLQKNCEIRKDLLKANKDDQSYGWIMYKKRLGKLKCFYLEKT